MIKAVFFDIDGTLLSFDTHKIPQSTYSAIEKLREKGIKIYVASGRPKFLLDSIKDIEFDGYITLNGSYVFENKEVYINNSLSNPELKKISKWNEEYDYPFVFMSSNGWFASKIDDSVIEICNHLEVNLPEVKSIENAYDMEIYQLMGYFPADLDNYLQENVFTECSLTRWHPLFCDIVHKDNDKREGILKILEVNNIDISESMAFGDGGNDISMLKVVGLGVAMGNANDSVKSVADYITESVDDDGILKALEHFKVI